jgi:hypothetical protein
VIDALLQGRLYGVPAERTDKHGKRYVTCKVRVSTRDGLAVFVNVIAFASPAVRALLALTDGDAVALAGELTPDAYAAKDGTVRPSLDLLAHAVLTEYHVARKRHAVRAADRAERELPFDDDLSGVGAA